jgi:hypothetical protein
MVPVVLRVSREIHAGGSLAGNDSIDASSTMSISCFGRSRSGTGSCEAWPDSLSLFPTRIGERGVLMASVFRLWASVEIPSWRMNECS